MFAGEHAGEFHPFDLALQIRQQFAHFLESCLVFALLAQFDQHQQIVEFVLRGGPVVDQLGQRGPLLQDLLGTLVVVPELRLGNLDFQFTDTLTLAIDVKDTSSARRAFPGVA